MRSSYHLITTLFKKAAAPGPVTGLVSGALGGIASTALLGQNVVIMGDQSAFMRDAVKSNIAGALAGALVGAGVGALASGGLKIAGNLAKHTFSSQTQILFPAVISIVPSFVGGAIASTATLEELEKRARARMC